MRWKMKKTNLARMGQFFDVIRFLGFPFIILDRNCLMSSVIVASPLTNSEADPFRRKMRRRFWLECEEGVKPGLSPPPQSLQPTALLQFGCLCVFLCVRSRVRIFACGSAFRDHHIFSFWRRYRLEEQ